MPEGIPWWTVLPFAALLLAIAVLPLAAPHFWEKNRWKAVVAAALALPVAGWLLATRPALIAHAAVEYGSFIALLGALFVIAGGIHVAGDVEGRPATNTAILATGALLASVIGTTGASMVLIRPLLRINRQRERTEHLPFFFILIVSNCGGLLTPLGDPPLFLGYLRGVPFEWTFRLWPVWLGALAYLLLVFFVIDKRAHGRERPEALARDAAEKLPLRVVGWRNLPVLAGVVGCVFLPTPWREIAMVALAAVSVAIGPRTAREANEFGWGPIAEVAILFAGIFVTMVPALELLGVHGRALGIDAPWKFFLVTGGLSSVLDNAPTYVTFLSAAQSLGEPAQVVGVRDVTLAAISCGAVLMGANTYIGNGPNFMVKAIADATGVKTASFFRYALAAVLVLAPVYVVLTVWFALTG